MQTSTSLGLGYAESQGLKLYPFQVAGVEAIETLVSELGGALVFDEMGLGKTMEFLAFVARMEPAPRTVLIFCPNTLKGEWKAATERWLGPDVAVFATGRGGLRRFTGLLEDEHWSTAHTRFLITNYETVRSKDYRDILLAFKADVLCFDEAHRLRNYDKKMPMAMREFEAPIQIVMTGTPVVNHAGDLWELVRRVAPDIAGSPSYWENHYVHTSRGFYGTQKFGVRNGEELKERLESIGIQRKKEEVLKELPPVVKREVPLDMVGQQRRLYEQMENELFVMLDEEGRSLTAPTVLAQITRLRQLCCDPRILGVSGKEQGVKTEFFHEMLEEIGNEQLVVFSNFERYVTLLQAELDPKYTSTRLTGKEKPETRTNNIARFTRGEAQIMFGTLQAGGEGVNLQTASRVIILDRWWSPVRNEQGIARVHRIGQEDSVEAILPHCVESIDDTLREILEKKYSVINELRIQGDTINLLRERRKHWS